jgi:purine-binding chemotaxis protein CheW
VSEVLEIPPAQVDRHAQFGRSSSRPVIAGIGRVGERVAILLDTAVLVSESDVALPADLSMAAE